MCSSNRETPLSLVRDMVADFGDLGISRSLKMLKFRFGDMNIVSNIYVLVLRTPKGFICNLEFWSSNSLCDKRIQNPFGGSSPPPNHLLPRLGADFGPHKSVQVVAGSVTKDGKGEG